MLVRRFLCSRIRVIAVVWEKKRQGVVTAEDLHARPPIFRFLILPNNTILSLSLSLSFLFCRYSYVRFPRAFLSIISYEFPGADANEG